MDKKCTLVIMAAGMSSRYGRLKQIDPIGPCEETLLEYSIYDAQQAGFNKFIFIVRAEIANVFQEKVLNKIPKTTNCLMVCQAARIYTPGESYLVGDRKPLGTGHALLALMPIINEPFGVINADDYYGKSAYVCLANFLSTHGAESHGLFVGYRLINTLSVEGPVSRGICSIDHKDRLSSILECYNIEWKNGKIMGSSDHQSRVEFTGNEIVSLNMWGFPPSFLHALQAGFVSFLEKKACSASSEYQLPEAVNSNLHAGKLMVNFKQSNNTWVGLTYARDRLAVSRLINKKVAIDEYPSPLWSASEMC